MNKIVRQKAIERLKAFYGKFNKRIKLVKDERFSVIETGEFVIVKLVYYGVRYSQAYKLTDLIK